MTDATAPDLVAPEEEGAEGVSPLRPRSRT